MKIKTTTLKQMMAKAVKGAGNNRMLPITQLIGIDLKDKKLTLITTDGVNTLKVINSNIEGENTHIVVPIDVINRLITRTTKETMELNLTDKSLEVKGNGNYNIELPVDENGDPITYPQIVTDLRVDEIKIKSKQLKDMIETNKSSLAETMERPMLTGYYIGDKIITTDSFKITVKDENLFKKELLIPSNLIDLIETIDEEDISVQVSDEEIAFKTSTVHIVGSLMDQLDLYPVTAVESFLDMEFEGVCTIDKKDLIAVVDRLSIFISPYDNNAIKLTFTEKGIEIQSRQSNAVELIKYKKVENDVQYECLVNIEFLKNLLDAKTKDDVQLQYGHDAAIKIVSDKLTQILALVRDDSNE